MSPDPAEPQIAISASALAILSAAVRTDTPEQAFSQRHIQLPAIRSPAIIHRPDDVFSGAFRVPADPYAGAARADVVFVDEPMQLYDKGDERSNPDG